MYSILAAAGIKSATPVSSKPVVSENAAIKRLDEIAEEIKAARKINANTEALYIERKQLMDYVWS